MGWPSCSRALQRIPLNLNDPNGYYAELGVAPWASHREIRRQVRKLLSTHHPDGPDPDEEKFMRYAEIAEVLADPDKKFQYDRLPEGKAWIDSRIRSMIDDGAAVRIAKKREKPSAPRHYDWFSTSCSDSDMLVAQQWYGALVAVAPIFSFTGMIKVLLHEGDPRWLPQANIMMIPRSWEPSSANAFALFSTQVTHTNK